MCLQIICGVYLTLAMRCKESAMDPTEAPRFDYLATAASTVVDRVASIRERISQSSIWGAISVCLRFGGDESKSRVAPSVCSYDLQEGCYANPIFIPVR